MNIQTIAQQLLANYAMQHPNANVTSQNLPQFVLIARNLVIRQQDRNQLLHSIYNTLVSQNIPNPTPVAQNIEHMAFLAANSREHYVQLCSAHLNQALVKQSTQTENVLDSLGQQLSNESSLFQQSLDASPQNAALLNPAVASMLSANANSASNQLMLGNMTSLLGNQLLNAAARTPASTQATAAALLSQGLGLPQNMAQTQGIGSFTAADQSLTSPAVSLAVPAATSSSSSSSMNPATSSSLLSQAIPDTSALMTSATQDDLFNTQQQQLSMLTPMLQGLAGLPGAVQQNPQLAPTSPSNILHQLIQKRAALIQAHSKVMTLLGAKPDDPTLKQHAANVKNEFDIVQNAITRVQQQLRTQTTVLPQQSTPGQADLGLLNSPSLTQQIQNAQQNLMMAQNAMAQRVAQESQAASTPNVQAAQLTQQQAQASNQQQQQQQQQPVSIQNTGNSQTAQKAQAPAQQAQSQSQAPAEETPTTTTASTSGTAASPRPQTPRLDVNTLDVQPVSLTQEQKQKVISLMEGLLPWYRMSELTYRVLHQLDVEAGRKFRVMMLMYQKQHQSIQNDVFFMKPDTCENLCTQFKRCVDGVRTLYMKRQERNQPSVNGTSPSAVPTSTASISMSPSLSSMGTAQALGNFGGTAMNPNPSSQPQTQTQQQQGILNLGQNQGMSNLAQSLNPAIASSLMQSMVGQAASQAAQAAAVLGMSPVPQNSGLQQANLMNFNLAGMSPMIAQSSLTGMMNSYQQQQRQHAQFVAQQQQQQLQQQLQQIAAANQAVSSVEVQQQQQQHQTQESGQSNDEDPYADLKDDDVFAGLVDIDGDTAVKPQEPNRFDLNSSASTVFAGVPSTSNNETSTITTKTTANQPVTSNTQATASSSQEAEKKEEDDFSFYFDLESPISSPNTGTKRKFSEASEAEKRIKQSH